MKASVQYNDFVGTAAADISDHLDLNEFLKKKGVDTERYDAIGASFYSGYSDYFSASILCVDKERSIKEEKHLVKINFENELTKDEFFDLFKRFEVIITPKHGGYEDLEIEDELTIE